MQTPEQGTLSQFGQQFADYLPTLAAGLFVLGVGVVVGWIAKRVVVRILVLLRLDRLAGGRSAWRLAFGKGDVRAALYGAVGSLAGLTLLLVFLDNALQIWGLTVLARMVDQVIIYVPTLALAGIIVGLGVMFANALARRVEAMLEREGLARAGLVAGMAKASLLCVVAALALWQLNFAREIVLVAFLIGFGAVGVAFALAVGIGSARAIQDEWSLIMKRRKEQ